MDELTAADVDAHMAEAGVEEYQIPGLQLPPGDGLAGVILGCAAVAQGDAVLREELHGQTRAVGAGAAGAAVHIGRAQEAIGVVHNGAAQIAAAGYHPGAEGHGVRGLGPGIDFRLGAHGIGAVVFAVVHRGADIGGNIAAEAAEGDQVPPACGVNILQAGHLAGVDGVAAVGAARIGVDGGAACQLHAVILIQQRQVRSQLLPLGLPGEGFRLHLVQSQKL